MTTNKFMNCKITLDEEEYDTIINAIKILDNIEDIMDREENSILNATIYEDDEISFRVEELENVKVFLEHLSGDLLLEYREE